MLSSALRSLKPSASSFAAIVGFAAVVFAVLGAGLARAQDAPATAPEADIQVPEGAVQSIPNPFADRFPNVVLKTHEGRNVRFYDDLLKGKIVLINFMYATCTER